jgi:ABC-type branched-subunit amino acid transport system ATPase component/branched-subunit amino acid ABC-type transport system permease component
MNDFIALCISGAVTGAIYSLVASGLTLSYSATGIFNFAYGGVAFSAAYVFYVCNTGLHWPNWVAGCFVLLVFAPLLGLLLDVAVFRHLQRATETAKIVATIGLLLALPALTEWVLDGFVDVFHVSIPRSADVLQAGFPAGLGPVPESQWHLPGNIPITSNEVVVMVAAVLTAGGLYLLLRKSTLGLRMRAVVDRGDLARMRGINDATTSRVAWVIGTVLAALAGILAAPLLGSINTNSYMALVFAASAAAVLGRLRSIPIAFAGGLAIGVAEDLVSKYATFAQNINGFNESVPVVILLGSLLFISKDRVRSAGQASEDVKPPDYLEHLPRWRRALPWVVATAFLIVYITVLANDFWAGVMAQGLSISLILLSLVIVTGMGGMVSLAQATFVSCAGLTTGLLFDHLGWPFYAAAALAVVITVIVGIAVALPALRLGGLSLALATLALAILGDNVLFQWLWLNNQGSGWDLPRLDIGPLDLSSNRTMALVLLAMVGLVMLLIRNLRVSSWGRAIAAVRSSQVGAATSGVSAVRVKLTLFALSAAIAGIGGIMYASFQTGVSNSTTPYIEGLLWLSTAVLFGIRRPAAAAFGGIVSAATTVIVSSGFHWWPWVPSWLSWNGTQAPEIPLILFGLGAVTLARHPDGFMAQMAEQRYKLALYWRARREPSVAAGQHIGGPSLVLAGVSASVASQQLLSGGNGAGHSGAAARTELTAISAEVARHEKALIESGAVRAAGDEVAEGAALLSIRSLHVAYGDVEVLHGIDLAIERGKISALLGANGGGKSTLSKTIAGLIQPTMGSLVFDGLDITAMPAHVRVTQGILVAPESRGIFPGLTVEENLMLRLDLAGREAVYERFSRLGERRTQVAGSLSGGEQQMLALSSLLVAPPILVIADEPTLGLAPLIVGQLLEFFEELRDAGTTVLLIEEKVRDILTIADHVSFLDLGHISWSGPRDMLDDDQLVGAYLGAELAGNGK